MYRFDVAHLICLSIFIGGDSQDGQQGATSLNPMDSLYRDVLKDQQEDSESVKHTSQSGFDHKQMPSRDPRNFSESDEYTPPGSTPPGSTPPGSTPLVDAARSRARELPCVAQNLTVNRPIGCVTSCCVTSCCGPVTLSGKVEEISDEEIRNNRETDDGIRGISRFQNYQRGEPSNVRLSVT